MDNNQATPKTSLDTIVFRETVPEAFSFLAAQHGCALVQENECLFIAQLKFCVIRIYLEWGDVVVTLQPVDARQIQSSSTAHRELGLALILACLNPAVEWPSGLITKPEELTIRIHQLAALLQRYCVYLFKGDFSDWAKFEAYGELLAKNWKTEQAHLIKEARLSEIRSKAEVAFREKDYSTAINLYESIQENLTPVELRKIDYAKKQLGNSGDRIRQSP